jgi:TRAP-type C4-dicarboxylate transport system permease small subunit
MGDSAVHILKRVNYYFCVFSALVLLAMMFLTTFDVVGRFFFDSPITGTFEVTEYMLAVLVLSGIGYTQQVKGHVRVTIFSSQLPTLVQHLTNGIFTILALIFFALLVLPAFEDGLHSMRAGGFSDMLQIPEFPFKLYICVGIILLSLELLSDLIISVRAFRKYLSEGILS